MVSSPDDEAGLEGMKYRDLQKVAKEVGVRANLPKVELIQKILEAKSSKAAEDPVESPAAADTDGGNDDDTPEGRGKDVEEVQIRRGKRKRPPAGLRAAKLMKASLSRSTSRGTSARCPTSASSSSASTMSRGTPNRLVILQSREHVSEVLLHGFTCFTRAFCDDCQIDDWIVFVHRFYYDGDGPDDEDGNPGGREPLRGERRVFQKPTYAVCPGTPEPHAVCPGASEPHGDSCYNVYADRAGLCTGREGRRLARGARNGPPALSSR